MATGGFNEGFNLRRTSHDFDVDENGKVSDARNKPNKVRRNIERNEDSPKGIGTPRYRKPKNGKGSVPGQESGGIAPLINTDEVKELVALGGFDETISGENTENPPRSGKSAPVEVATPAPVVPAKPPVRGVRSETRGSVVNNQPPIFESRADLVKYIRNLLDSIPPGMDPEKWNHRIPEETLHALRSLGGAFENAHVAFEAGKRVIRYGNEKKGLTHGEVIQILKNEVNPKNPISKRSRKLSEEERGDVNGEVIGMIPKQEIDDTGEPVFFGDDGDNVDESTAQTNEGIVGQSNPDEVVPVLKEIISAPDYDVVPLTGEHLSYVMNVSVEDLDVSTHCPPELVEALESIGAQVLDYGDQNADVPLRFLLINAEKKVVELSMNAQEVVTFLKSTLSLPKSDFVLDALPSEPHVIEEVPVDPVVTLEEVFPYKTLPLQKQRSYVEGLPIKNMQTNIWPQYLLAALKEVGAKEVTDKKRKVGEPRKFTLPNHSGELIELEMSPIDAAKFLKDELARLRDIENKSIDVTPLPYVAPDTVTPTVPVSPTALEKDASTSNVEVVPMSVSQGKSDILERADLEKFEEELKKARNKEQENSVEATPLVVTELMPSGVSSLKTHEEHKVAEFPSTVIEENDAEPVPVASISMKEKDLHPYEKLVVNQEHDSVIKKRREIQELAQNFDSQFGISAEELTQIEGFDNLTLPQQKLVYENLVQSALGHVKEESLSQYSKEQSAKRAEANNPYGKLIGNVWAGIRSVLTKDFNLIKIEKEIIAKFANGGLLTHRAILEQLVRGVPRVHQDEKTGEILVDLVNMKLDRDNRSAEYEAVRKLNDVAHKFAKIPLAWREDTLGVDGGKEKEWGITKMFKERFSESRKHHLKYEESEKAFNDARGKLELTLKAGGRKDKEIAQILLGVDSRVNQLQFIQTSPDAVAELGNIKDKNIYIQTAKSLFMSGPGFGKSGLGYVALGSVVRTMTASLLGGFAAPVVSSCIAASKSWSKTAAELRERDRNARRGIKDNSEDALNIVSADTLAKKTKLLIDRYNALQEKIPRQLSEGADSADDLRKEIALLEQIKERIAYIHDKQKLNKVDYGARGQSIGKQVELYELLGEATVLVHDWVDPHDEKHVSNRERHIERLIRDTIAHESDIDAKRRSYRMKELAKQAAKAGLFAVAGYLIMDHFKDLSAERAQILKESGEVAPAGSHAVTESVADAAGAHAPAPKSPEVGSVLSREQGSGDLSVKKEASLDNLAEVPKVEALKPYSIKSGDTLTKILKEQLPVIKKIDSPLDKDRALANLFRLLKSDDLNAIGLRSGVADSIYAGETIDLDKLNKIIGEKGGIVRFLRRQ
jgi:hypothetical protein